MREIVFEGSPVDVRPALAHGLLQVHAVELRPRDPFTWSSGWKSPIYCDNRLTLSFPALRNAVAEGFQSIIEERYPGVNVIVGAATGGIAHAAIVADRLGLPTAYVRSSAKGHGKQKRVEGHVFTGARCIVIEDTLSTGNSAFSVVEALREEADADVLAVCSIFSYDFDVLRTTAERFAVPVHRLLDYPTLIDVAVEQGYVRHGDVAALLAWRMAPDKYGIDD